jgi:ferredoxin
VKLDEVRRLREAWQAKGNPPCEHAIIDSEYHLDALTGHKVCMACGAYVSKSPSGRSSNSTGSSIPEERTGYRRHKDAETWHFCASCFHWPKTDYSFSPIRPAGQNFCNECLSRVASGTCG